jgi:hypothetical protein
VRVLSQLESDRRDYNERWRHSAENIEKCINDIVLTHEDGTKEIGDRNFSDLLCGGSSHQRDNEYGNIDNENDAEESAIKSENLMSEIANDFALRFVRDLVVFVSRPRVPLFCC